MQRLGMANNEPFFGRAGNGARLIAELVETLIEASREISAERAKKALKAARAGRGASEAAQGALWGALTQRVAPLLKKRGENLTAAWLRVEKRDDEWENEFTRAGAKDDHLAPFAGIPGKDNGLDIEGLAVAEERVFVGLRGPVLRGYALILELEPQAQGSELKLKNIGPGDRPYRKHFMHLGGLGIRDLCLRGDDMLILAGPTMELDAPYKIFRWADGANPKKRSVLQKGELQTVVEIAQSGADGFAEGMTLFKQGAGDADSILVVYDAATGRKEGATIRGDIFGPLF